MRSWYGCPRTQRRDDQAGAAAVEFALILPVLLTVVFGIIAFGILFAQQLSLGNGARQGARFGVVPNNTCLDIKSQVQSGSQTIGMKAADIAVKVSRGTTEVASTDLNCSSNPTKVPCQGSTSGDKLFIYATYPSKVTVPLVPVSKTMNLQAIGVFRCEFS